MIIFLLVLWLIFSGSSKIILLAFGIFSVGLVNFTTRKFIRDDMSWAKISWREWRAFFVYYLPWIIKESIISTVFVTKIIINRNIKSNFSVIELKTKGLGQPLLIANSVTFTPGTITVALEQEGVLVHALSESLLEGVKVIEDKVVNLT